MSDLSNLSKEDRKELLKAETSLKVQKKEVNEIEVVQNVEVFGTKEVSVKEFMGSTDKSLMILENYDLSKENLVALKVKHEARVEALVLIEKLTPAELKELSSIRGELREPRYLVQKIESNNISVFESYKKMDKANLKTLIDINKELEVKADDKIKLEEERKKKEKLEEANAEALRVKTINDKIDEIEASCYEVIQKMVFSEIEFSKTQLFAFFTIEFDFEEYDILFDQAKSRIESALENKVNSLTASEKQRLDNIRLEEETAELKRLSDLQAERLTAIMPYVAFGQSVDLTKLSELTKGEWELIFDAKKALFEADAKAKKEAQDKLDAENLERENKAKADKEKIFEIRVNRLAEIGIVDGGNFFENESKNVKIVKEAIFDLDAIDFETIITDAKLAIEKAKEEQERTDKQKAIDLKLSKEDAERLKKENKERGKRLAKEKASFAIKIQEGVILLPIGCDNEEISLFIENANSRIQALKTELLTELEKL